MVLALVCIFIGFFKLNTGPWWRATCVAVAIQVAADFLFASTGSISHPEGEGLVTRYIRETTNDANSVAALEYVALVFGWGVPIMILLRGYRQSQFRTEVP